MKPPRWWPTVERLRWPCSPTRNSPTTSSISRACSGSCANGTESSNLFLLQAGELEGDRSPEKARPHLHGHMTLVVRVPDPDIAAILHHSGIGRGLHADGLICARRRLDGFLALRLHGDGNGFSCVKNWDLEALAY